MINRSNYEQFFLDFYDGSLSASQQEELFAFLEKNPDLKSEFESFEKISLSPTEKVFFDKDRLKKNTITLYNYKTYFIASVENDLSDDEKIEVQRFLERNPSLKPEFEIVKQTKLFPDYSIRFENKNSLKKGGKVIALNAWIYRSAAVAASIALILVFIYTINKKEVNTEVAVSANKNKEQVSSPAQPLVDAKKEKPAIQGEQRQNDIFLRKRSADAKMDTLLADGTDEKEAVMPVAEVIKEKVPMNVEINDVDVASVNDAALKEKYRVFTDEELAELTMNENPGEEQSIISKAAGSIGKKLFGQNAKIENRKNEQDSSTTFALAFGQFEFSRTTSK
jgi:hypothetical protein